MCGELDDLALAGGTAMLERRQRGDGGVAADGEEVQLAVSVERCCSSSPLERGRTRQRTGDQVRCAVTGPRPRPSERGDADNHQRGPRCEKLVRTRFEAVQQAAIEHDVDRARQPEQLCPSSGVRVMLEVQHHRLTGGAEIGIPQGGARVLAAGEGCAVAQRIAAFRLEPQRRAPRSASSLAPKIARSSVRSSTLTPASGPGSGSGFVMQQHYLAVVRVAERAEGIENSGNRTVRVTSRAASIVPAAMPASESAISSGV